MKQPCAGQIESRSFASESGAVLVLVAVLMAGLLAFGAMAVDVGHLMVVRNELQNAADAAALAGAQRFYPGSAPAVPNWASAEALATASVSLNKSGGTTLADAVVQSGYWNFSRSPSGLQAKGITPGTQDVPAVLVRVSRDVGQNGGPVVNSFASILGIPLSAVSAQAIAVSASPGVAFAGAILPLAISKAVADQAGIYDDSGNTVRIGSAYHYPTSMAGQWTSLETDENSVTAVRGLIEEGNPTALHIGDNIWIQPGTKTALYGDVPVGEDVLLPVVDVVLSDVTHSETPVYAFIGFRITASVGGSGKYVEGYFLPSFYAGLSGPIGPNYGVYSPPRLVQ